jgi:hypothetical protein
MIELKVVRTNRFSKSLGGDLFVDGEFVCHTLELPWRWNKKNISCIPVGKYRCFWRHDRDRIQVVDIPCPGGSRVAIQFHAGNAPKDSRGCVLVGKTLRANSLGASKAAMRLLEEAVWGKGLGVRGTRKRITLKVEGLRLNSFREDIEAGSDAPRTAVRAGRYL